MDEDSTVRVNRKRELVMVSEKEAGNAMIGIAYLTGREAQIVRENLRRMDTDEDFDDEFWERALYGERDRMILQAKTVSAPPILSRSTLMSSSVSWIPAPTTFSPTRSTRYAGLWVAA